MNTRSVPEASTPSLCSQKSPPRGTLRWKEWCKCAGIAGAVVALQAGCPGAQVRQSPTEECRKEAVEAMKLLEVRFYSQFRVQVDLATPKVPAYEADTEGCGNGPCLVPGPVRSVVLEGSGELVRGTLLSGRVFTYADRSNEWEIRWTEATLPNGDKHPVCINGGQNFDKCPSGGGRICSELLVVPVKQWEGRIIP